MSNATFLNDILNNLLNRKIIFRSFSRSKDSNDNFSIEDLVNNILNSKGEASANILSEQLLGKIEKLNQNELLDFFNYLAEHHDIDGEILLVAKPVNRAAKDTDAQGMKCAQGYL